MTFFTRNTLIIGTVLTVSSAAHSQTAPAGVPAEAPVVGVAPVAPPGSLLAPGAAIGMPYKKYLYRRYAADEEAKAVIHAYARRQTGGLLWLLGGAATIGLITTQTGPTVSSSGTRTIVVTPLGYGLLGGLFGGVGGGKLLRFGNGPLYKVLADYDRTHAFSGEVLARVEAKDYR